MLLFQESKSTNPTFGTNTNDMSNIKTENMRNKNQV